MALYGRFGDAVPAAPVPASSDQSSALGLGFLLGLLPLVLVGLAFWAILAPPPNPKSTYRGRKH